MKKRVFDFNKELIFGELGALISVPIVGFLVSLFTENVSAISSAAVIASLVGASAFWIFMRIFDEKQRKAFTFQHFAAEIGYFTPVAFLIAVLVYYPSLFFISRNLLAKEAVIYAVITAQAVAFSLFLVAMNFYRHLLFRLTGEEL